MIPAIVGGTTATISAVAAKLSDVAVTTTLTALYVRDAIVKAASTVKTISMTAAQTAWNVIAAAGAIAAKALGAAIAFLTSPIGLVIAAIAAIIAIGVLLWKNWDIVKEKASALGAYLKEKFNNIKEAIMSPIRTATDFISKQVDKIKGFFSNLKNKTS